METKTEPRALELLKQEVPALKAVMALNAKEGVDVETLALVELEHIRNHALTKPEILQCVPQTVLIAVRAVLKQNLTLDPFAGLVYMKTRNVKIKNADGSESWVKALEISPSANGLISIARQCGRILDIERPEVEKDAAGKVIAVKVKFLVPSHPAPRWQEVRFEEDDFYRWQRASHKENGRNKQDANLETLNYANENYTSWKGGIDPEFARAKAIRHGLKKLGTNPNEILATRINITNEVKTIVVDARADEQASEEEVTSYSVEDVVKTPAAEPIPVMSNIPNAAEL